MNCQLCDQCERATAPVIVASDEAPAEERQNAASVAGKRNDGLRGRGTQMAS